MSVTEGGPALRRGPRSLLLGVLVMLAMGSSGCSGTGPTPAATPSASGLSSLSVPATATPSTAATPSTKPTPTAAPTSPAPTPTPKPTATAKPTTSPTASAQPSLVSGKVFGKIKSLNAAGYVVLIDRAEMLTGEAANEAARKAGVIGPGESVPNDYWIEDLHVVVKGFLAPGMVVQVVGETAGSMGLVDADVMAFITDYTKYHVKEWPYFYFTMENGYVKRIEQVYLP